MQKGLKHHNSGFGGMSICVREALDKQGLAKKAEEGKKKKEEAKEEALKEAAKKKKEKKKGKGGGKS